MSIKYIGAFTVAFVGIHTAYQLMAIVLSSERSLVSERDCHAIYFYIAISFR